MKPAVGFTLPWAGAIAPERCGTSSLLEGVGKEMVALSSCHSRANLPDSDLIDKKRGLAFETQLSGAGFFAPRTPL